MAIQLSIAVRNASAGGGWRRIEHSTPSVVAIRGALKSALGAATLSGAGSVAWPQRSRRMREEEWWLRRAA